MGCNHIPGAALANSCGPSRDAAYALYTPEHVAHAVKRTRALVGDVLYAAGLKDASKGVLLRTALDLLSFLDSVMSDSLPSLGDMRFRRYARPCGCGCAEAELPKEPNKPQATTTPARPAKKPTTPARPAKKPTPAKKPARPKGGCNG